MTSFIAAGGSGRSTSVIPAVPAASSVTTIALMGIVSSLACLFGGSRTNTDDRLPADPLQAARSLLERSRHLAASSSPLAVPAGAAEPPGLGRRPPLSAPRGSEWAAWDSNPAPWD